MLQKHSVKSLNNRLSTFPLAAAKDSIVQVNDGLPIHPDPNRSTPMEIWEEQLREKHRKKTPAGTSKIKQPPNSSDHLIDEYASNFRSDCASAS